MASCKVKRPDDVLPESTMENLLYDYHIAKAMGDNLPYSENYKKVLYTDAVFNKYGTSEAIFDSSMVWYTRNTEILTKLYEKVNKKLKDQQNSINHLIAMRDKKPMISTPGDSIDVWAWQRMVRLTGMPMNNKLTFNLPTDSNFKERDTLVWKVRYNFLENKLAEKPTALMAMQIVFQNDSIISITKQIKKSGIQIIRLQSDTLGTIKEINGFIYYPGEKRSGTLLADQMSLTRYHANDSLKLHTDSVKTYSIKKATLKEEVDTAQVLHEQQQRLSPEEMNRRRTNQQQRVRPEQLEVESHIQLEKQQLQRERKTNQRRRTQ